MTFREKFEKRARELAYTNRNAGNGRFYEQALLDIAPLVEEMKEYLEVFQSDWHDEVCGNTQSCYCNNKALDHLNAWLEGDGNGE